MKKSRTFWPRGVYGPARMIFTKLRSSRFTASAPAIPYSRVKLSSSPRKYSANWSALSGCRWCRSLHVTIRVKYLRRCTWRSSNLGWGDVGELNEAQVSANSRHHSFMPTSSLPRSRISSTRCPDFTRLRHDQLNAMKAVPRTARKAPSQALTDGACPVLSHTIGRTRIGASEDNVDTIPTLPLASAAIKRDRPRPVAMTAPAALIAKWRNENA